MPDRSDAPPARRTLAWRDFAVTLQVPGRVGKLARRVLPRRSKSATLEFAQTPPTLHLTPRDLDEAAESWKSPDEFVRVPTVRSPEDAASELVDEIAAINWYHTIELPGGIVTPGVYDHRPLVPHYGLPDDLSGQRVLDVAPFDGFWSFEFERRGAQVTALDIPRWSELDHPTALRGYLLARGIDGETGAGFRLAAGLLDSKVDRVTGNVYDLSPDSIGTFDLVHVGDLLLHLRDPLRALERIRSVTAGRAMIVDSVSDDLPSAPGRYITEYLGGWRDTVWWLPSVQTLAQMVIDAGFADVRLQQMFRLDLKFAPGAWRAILHATPDQRGA